MPSGFCDVTRWPPRTLWSAWRIASRPAAWRSSSAWASPPTSAMPRSRCSVETYSSPRRRASASASSMTRLARGSSDSEPPWIRARRARIAGELAAERGQVDAEPAERLGGDPVVGLDEGGQEVLGVEDRAVEPLGGGLGGDDRLLGLLGESVELHRRSPGLWVSGDRVGRRGRRRPAAASRLVGQVGREDDPGLDVEVAVAGRLEAGHALALEPERPAGLGPRRDREQDAALERASPGPRRRAGPPRGSAGARARGPRRAG